MPVLIMAENPQKKMEDFYSDVTFIELADGGTATTKRNTKKQLARGRNVLISTYEADGVVNIDIVLSRYDKVGRLTGYTSVNFLGDKITEMLEHRFMWHRFKQGIVMKTTLNLLTGETERQKFVFAFGENGKVVGGRLFDAEDGYKKEMARLTCERYDNGEISKEIQWVGGQIVREEIYDMNGKMVRRIYRKL